MSREKVCLGSYFSRCCNRKEEMVGALVATYFLLQSCAFSGFVCLLSAIPSRRTTSEWLLGREREREKNTVCVWGQRCMVNEERSRVINNSSFANNVANIMKFLKFITRYPISTPRRKKNLSLALNIRISDQANLHELLTTLTPLSPYVPA